MRLRTRTLTPGPLCHWCLLLLVFGLSITTGRAAKPPAHPNILLIVTDQQHAGMMSCTGNRYLQTPAMDALASGGVRFERAYCANPVCIPSRFSMFTGVLPTRVGLDKNGKAEVPPEILSHAMGRVFARQGYRAVYGGKIHLPGTRAGEIAPYGFEYLCSDERDGLAAACADFLKQKHDKPFLLVASFINPHDICYMALDAHSSALIRPLAYPESTSERQEMTRALELPAGISREAFFRDVCPPLPPNFEIPPHEPSAARTSDWREFRQYVQEQWKPEDWRLHRWAYARLTERVDRQVGVVLDALRAAKLEENTVVVFTSDHGDLDGAHRLEHKSMPYEEATRVPLIVRYPPGTAVGKVDKEHLVSVGLDLIPTLCDFAGITTPKELRGRSFKDLATARNQATAWRSYLAAENHASRIVWSRKFKYWVYDSGSPREMLVDLSKDPGEMRNLAVEAAFETELKRHRELLRRWYARNGETLHPKYVVNSEP